MTAAARPSDSQAREQQTFAACGCPVDHRVIFDVSTLRFVREGSRVQVLSRSGIHLGATRLTAELPVAGAVEQALESAAATELPVPSVSPDGQVTLVAAQVGFYNPYSAQVNVGGTSGQLFVADTAVPVAEDGTRATGCTHTLVLDGVTMRTPSDVAQTAWSAIDAHRYHAA